MNLNWYGKNCEHQNCLFDRKRGATPANSTPDLIYCDHPRNPDEYEGNCRKDVCPKTGTTH